MRAQLHEYSCILARAGQDELNLFICALYISISCDCWFEIMYSAPRILRSVSSHLLPSSPFSSRLQVPLLEACNSLLRILAAEGRSDEALRVVHNFMPRLGVLADQTTFSSLVDACVRGNDVDQALETFEVLRTS